MTARQTMALLLVVLPLTPTAMGQNSKPAVSFLNKALDDEKQVRSVLGVIGTVRDPDSQPLLLACLKSVDADYRLFAVRALAALETDTARDALIQRYREEGSAEVRAEVLYQLVQLQAANAALLQQALLDDDESIRALAALALLKQKRQDLAEPALQRIADAKDETAACLARTALLGLGQRGQLAPLRKLAEDPKTPDELLARMLAQITAQKMSGAYELVEAIASSDRPAPLRHQAYIALAAIDPNISRKFALEIGKTSNIVLQAHLLQLLSDRKDARSYLQSLAGGEDASGAIASLARFELTRAAGGGAALTRAATRALVVKNLRGERVAAHPIAIRYILMRAEEDRKAEADKAKPYVPALLGYIRSTRTDSSQMYPEHLQAAKAATFLADFGTPEALAGLKEILAGRYTPVLRATAAGIRHTNNRQAAELLRPLLDRPYAELQEDAALALGKNRAPSAAGLLAELLNNPERHSLLTNASAAWCLLKINGDAARVAAELAKKIK